MKNREGFFHLHMISDATGETLITVGRAAAAQYRDMRPVEHIHSMVRTRKQLDMIVAALEEEPGIVLYTLVDKDLGERLEQECRRIGIPCASVLEPVLQLLQNYLGAPRYPPGRRPAHARRRLFPPHRRAELHHDP